MFRNLFRLGILLTTALSFKTFAFEVVVNRSEYADRQSFSVEETPKGSSADPISVVVQDILKETSAKSNAVEVQEVLMAKLQGRTPFEVGQILGGLLSENASFNIQTILAGIISSCPDFQAIGAPKRPMLDVSNFHVEDILKGLLANRSETELVQIVKAVAETGNPRIQTETLKALVSEYPKVNVYDILKQASKNRVNVDFMDCLKSGKLYWIVQLIRAYEAKGNQEHADKLKAMFNKHFLEWINSDEDDSIPTDGPIE